jgi:hypothetical protein
MMCEDRPGQGEASHRADLGLGEGLCSWPLNSGGEQQFRRLAVVTCSIRPHPNALTRFTGFALAHAQGRAAMSVSCGCKVGGAVHCYLFVFLSSSAASTARPCFCRARNAGPFPFRPGGDAEQWKALGDGERFGLRRRAAELRPCHGGRNGTAGGP